MSEQTHGVARAIRDRVLLLETDSDDTRAPELGREIARLGEELCENSDAPKPAAAAALAASRVDLVEVIRDGIPERQYVPGCEGWLIAGKRYLIPAPAGTGKSLLGLVAAVGVVEAGGTVSILDVENGADEYARRLEDVLKARDADGELARACSERLRYYAWPALRVTWSPEDWAAPFDGVDLAVFDSSRLVLSTAGLAEDSNDDYAMFVNALLVPLARAGSSTMTLDNTGHEERDRARGASAKADLNEVVYVVKRGEEFDRDQHGHLRLVRKRTRFSELPAELKVPLGGGVYGPPVVAEPDDDGGDFRPTYLMERLSQTIEDSPGSTTTELRRVKGKSDALDEALRLLIRERHVEVKPDGQAHRHHSLRPYREHDETGSE
ncbi:MAG: AAA family ATPase [Actinomycetota bacterium]